MGNRLVTNAPIGFVTFVHLCVGAVKTRGKGVTRGTHGDFSRKIISTWPPAWQKASQPTGVHDLWKSGTGDVAHWAAKARYYIAFKKRNLLSKTMTDGDLGTQFDTEPGSGNHLLNRMEASRKSMRTSFLPASLNVNSSEMIHRMQEEIRIFFEAQKENKDILESEHTLATVYDTLQYDNAKLLVKLGNLNRRYDTLGDESHTMEKEHAQVTTQHTDLIEKHEAHQKQSKKMEIDYEQLVRKNHQLQLELDRVKEKLKEQEGMNMKIYNLLLAFVCTPVTQQYAQQ
jgi:hypothetical protein